MTTTKLVDCPECGLPAITRADGLPAITRADGPLAGTGGPVEHVHLRCVTGHRFFGPSETLLHRRRGR